MLSSQLAFVGAPASATRTAHPAPAQPIVRSGKQPFSVFAALNRVSLFFSESRTAWAMAGRKLP